MTAWTNADKAEEAVRRGNEVALPLLHEAIEPALPGLASDLRAIQAKDAEVDRAHKETCRLAGEVERLAEFGDLEEAKENRKKVRERLLDNPDYHAANAKVKAAKGALSHVAVVQEHKRAVVVEHKLSQASIEYRRQLFQRLRESLGPKVITVEAAPAPLHDGKAAAAGRD